MGHVDNELERRLEALEKEGLGESLTRGQIGVFAMTCFVLPIVIAILGRGLVE